MRIYALSFVAIALIGCGSGSSSFISAPNYQKTADFPLASKLYSRADLAAADGRLVSSSQHFSLPAGFGGAISGAGLVLALIDAGVDYAIAPGLGGFYDYAPELAQRWPSESDRQNLANFVHKNYTYELIRDDKCSEYGPCTHGKNVAAVARKHLPELKFANITYKNPGATADDVNIAASVDALSLKGVRFFNRSLGNGQSASVGNEGDYLTAIYYRNALVVNAAGNKELGGEVSENALSPNSPLRAGWIIATGYASSPSALQSDEFYINTPSGKKFVYPRGNSCKRIGREDCIAAPYVVQINDPAAGSLQLSGTSFSAPLVSAAAMSVYAKFPWMSNAQIKQTLFSTAYEVHGGTENERKNHFGAGVLNAAAAMHGPAEFGSDYGAGGGEFIADVSEGLYVFSNDISGSGGLIKNGPGTLALSGRNSFSGDIYNTAGALWLTGENAADVYNSALLRLGRGAKIGALDNSAQLVSEGFRARSLQLDARSKIYANLGDEMQIERGAHLAGEFNLVGLAPNFSLASSEQSVRILRAGYVSGEFDHARSLSPFLALSRLEYLPSEVRARVWLDGSLSQLPELNYYARQNYVNLINAINYRLEQAAKPATTSQPSGMSMAQMSGGYEAMDYASEGVKFSSESAQAPGGEMVVTEQKTSSGEKAPGGESAVTDQKSSGSEKAPGGEIAVTEQKTSSAIAAARLANDLANLSAEGAAALAPVLFGERSQALTASKLAAARVVLNAFSQQELPIFGALVASSKAGGQKRTLAGGQLSFGGEIFTSVYARAQGFAAADSEDADILALGGALDISLSDRLSLQLDLAHMWHSDEQNSRALMAQGAASFYQPVSKYFALGFRLGADVISLNNSSINLAPAMIDASQMTTSSQFVSAFVHLKSPRVYAMLSGGVRANNQYEYSYSGQIEGAKINNLVKVLAKNTYMGGLNVKFNMTRSAALTLDISSEFGKDYYVNQAKFGFKYSF